MTGVSGRTQVGITLSMNEQERSAEQEIASGRPAWTPFALLGSVFGVIAVLVVVALGLAALAYFLA